MDHPPELSPEDKAYVEITSGLKGGEQVVISGTSKLATGVPVTIKPATTQAASKPATKE